jgi:amino acid permease
VFIFLALMLGYKAWDMFVRKQRILVKKLEDIDFTEGLEEIESLTERAEKKRASKPRTRWQRTVDKVF